MPVTALDSSSALVIIDLQNAIVSAPTTPYTGPEVVARVVELTRAFHEHSTPVALIRVTARADGSDATPGRTEIPTRPGSLPEGWDAIVDDLADHPDDITVTKRTWGAFYGTDLDLQLRRRGVTQIVLAGLTTSLGVESTARAAYEHGYHVTLATDAMADLDVEAHRNRIERIFPLSSARPVPPLRSLKCLPKPATDTQDAGITRRWRQSRRGRAAGGARRAARAGQRCSDRGR